MHCIHMSPKQQHISDGSQPWIIQLMAPLEACWQENCKGATRAALWPQPGLISGCGNKHWGEMGHGCSALNNYSAWHGNGITMPEFAWKIHHLLHALVLGDNSVTTDSHLEFIGLHFTDWFLKYIWNKLMLVYSCKRLQDSMHTQR